MRPPRAQPTPSIDIPCIRNCCLNERDICLGCGRNLTEILHWQSFSMEQRKATLENAEQRRNEQKNY
ncbi:MAG: DUF1289 domain-containing protein [Spongiibacteraceae bacterium]